MAEGSPSHPRSARPTTYRGIEMRSRLEAGYAAWLDRRGWDWSYEPRAFGSEAGQYLPDFQVNDVQVRIPGQEPRTSTAFVEVKPSYAGLDHDQVARRMAVIWESDPDALLLLQAPKPHESMRIPLGRVGLTEFGSVLHASAQVFVLLRLPAPRWSMFAWIAGPSPLVGHPFPADQGPWGTEYWNVPAREAS